MKSILFVLLLLLIVVPVYGAPLSDKTGFVKKLDVKTDGYEFQIETVANFDIDKFEFDKDQKRLTFHIFSGLENNLAEVYLPQNLLSGNFTFYDNGKEISPKIKKNSDISFITLNFTGAGAHKIEIFGTIYLREVSSIKNETANEDKLSSNGGGCLIATATFGSELAPQVQHLRELRDTKLLQTESGTRFMNSFNAFYYSFSPVIADLEREHALFKETVKITLIPMLSSLSILNYVDFNSEVEVLGYGISLILLNLGIYFVLPTILVMNATKKFRNIGFIKLLKI